MFYNNLKKIIKRSKNLWKFLTFIKRKLNNFLRLKDVLMMMLLLNVWPEQAYRFSTRKLLPCKKNRLPKTKEPIFPYELLKSKSSDIPRMKEVHIVARGSSFDLNNLKKLNGPIFLTSFYSPVKTDSKGRLFYEHYKDDEAGKLLKDYKEDFSEKVNKDYKNKNIIYVNSRHDLLEMLKKNGHEIMSIETHLADENGDFISTLEPISSYLELINSGKCKRISIAEKIYLTPMLPPYANWAPTGSLLQTICALSYFADKINVYGWDSYLKNSPKTLNKWSLLLKMYKYNFDTIWRAQFESALINFYYGFSFSRLSHISIFGHVGQLGNHEKLIKKIERVLFN
tara:strand:- start:14 stop:1036 length:1023 start_codon:yes stop_codon:yes gene_type:complete